MASLSSVDRVRLTQRLIAIPNLVERLRSKIQKIKAQKGAQA